MKIDATKRAWAIRMFHENKSNEEIAWVIGLSEKTVERLLNAYAKSIIPDAIKKRRKSPPPRPDDMGPLPTDPTEYDILMACKEITLQKEKWTQADENLLRSIFYGALETL